MQHRPAVRSTCGDKNLVSLQRLAASGSNSGTQADRVPWQHHVVAVAAAVTDPLAPPRVLVYCSAPKTKNYLHGCSHVHAVIGLFHA